MKSIKLLLAILIAFVCFTACSSDDDEPNLPETPTKRIKQISSGGDAITFSYSGDKLEKITAGWYSTKGSITFKYETGKVIITEPDWGTEEYDTDTYTLGSNGQVQSGRGDIYQYDSDGHLINMSEGEGYDHKYVYKNGNIVSSPNFESITMSDFPNIGGLYVAEEWGHFDARLRHCGLFGKPSKNLPQSASSDENGSFSYSYKLDKDGYVTEMTVNRSNGVSWTETYTYEPIP